MSDPVTPEEHNSGSRRACLEVIGSSGQDPWQEPEFCNLEEGHEGPCEYIPPLPDEP